MINVGFTGRVCGAFWLSAGLFLAAVTHNAQGQEAGQSSPWHEAYMSQVRLIAGRRGESGDQVVAGLHIALQPGWKTYWRNPGDAGGVPPEFDWAGSENVAEAKVLYPAPERFSDKSGETIGYKGGVVMPVLVRPADPERPVVLRARFNYGICSDICVPVEAELTLEVPRQTKPGLPPELQEALNHTPRSGGSVQPGDPKLVRHEVHLKGDKPRIVLDVDLGPDPKKGDVFVETSDSIYLPMPQRAQGGSPATSRFEIDLRETDDLGELNGKTVRVTLVGAEGQTETSFVIE